MQLNLVPHPSTLPGKPEFKVWVGVEHSASLAAVATTNIWFGVGAPAERFVISDGAESERADELWKTTCFEAFLRPMGEESYREWNFAPSSQWAAYRFTGYRQGMAPLEEFDAPGVEMKSTAALCDVQKLMNSGTHAQPAVAGPPTRYPEFTVLIAREVTSYSLK